MVRMVRAHRVEFEQTTTHLTGARRVDSNKMRSDDTNTFASSVLPHFLLPTFLKVQPVRSTGAFFVFQTIHE